MRGIWIFVSEGASLPSAAFDEEGPAREWIGRHALSGVLTQYPVNVSVYDWAIENGFFEVKSPSHRDPKFVGRFTSASLKHFHFENGQDS